jgi:hypothetical protein
VNVLLITKTDAPVPINTFWNSLGQHCRLEKKEFGPAEMEHFEASLAALDFSRYDRVLLYQNIRRIGRRYPVLRTVPNLVLLEHDACQQFMRKSPWCGRYDKVFRDISTLRVLVSNRTSEKIFREAGIDCVYVPKAYDDRNVRFLGRPRDIDFGYIGRVKHRVYEDRRKLLAAVQKPLNLQMLRTEFGDVTGYNDTLNRIRFFVSADIGMKEFMFKNFEAMAAGCVVLAQRQPDYEQAALGFEDMKNIVLYDGADELIARAEQLRNDPDLAERIAAAGRALVTERHTMTRRGAELAEALRPAVQPAPRLSTGEKLRYLWTKPFWRK